MSCFVDMSPKSNREQQPLLVQISEAKMKLIKVDPSLLPGQRAGAVGTKIGTFVGRKDCREPVYSDDDRLVYPTIAREDCSTPNFLE